MTTAHRPTWKAAVGQSNEGGGWFVGGTSSSKRSALDAPAHTKLKLRQGQQRVTTTRDELLRQSLLELQQAEQQMSNTKGSSSFLLPRKPINLVIEERAKQKLLKQTAEVDIQKIKDRYDDDDIEDDEADHGNQSNPFLHDDSSSSTDLDEYDDDDDDDDDEDDEAALQAELAKIRAEREETKRKEEEAMAAEENAKLEAAALFGNPLLQSGHNPNNHDDTMSTSNTTLYTTTTANGNGTTSNGRFKRRWNDDVVFRNQALGEPEPKKRFINDTVRNDFHKRFLQKFIR
jgi:protein CWC15